MRASPVVRRTTVVIAVFAVLILVGSTVGISLLSASSVAGGAPPAPTVGLPKAVGPTMPSNLSWLTPSMLQAAALAEFPSMASTIHETPPSVFTAAVREIQHPHEAKGLTDGFTSQQFVGLGLVAGAIAVGAVCIAAGAVTFGLGCIAALAVLAVIAVWNYLFNGAAFPPPTGINWQNVAQNMVLTSYQRWAQQADDVSQLDSTLNLTQYALGYEAAAGALAQIGNSTFSTALDLQQSSVAQQLMLTLTQDGLELSQGVAQLLNAADLIMGSQNTGNTYCYVTNTGGAGFSGSATTVTAPSGVGSCPISGTATAFAWGTIQPVLDYANIPTLATPKSCPALYLVGGESISANAAAGTGASSNGLTFVPVSNLTAHPSRNVTVNWTGKYSVTSVNVSFNGSTGAYYVCSADFADQISLYATASLSLTAPSANQAIQQLFISSTAAGSELSSNVADLMGADFCAGAASYCAGPMGDTNIAGLTHAARSPQTQLVTSVYGLSNYAGTVGATYWAYLRSLGYTSISQIPANCIIPSPNVALPPNLNVNDLPTNVSQLTELYYSFLHELATTFNASTALTSFNFCGKHVTYTVGSTPFPLGSYAFGYVYVPSAKNNSAASAHQFFGTPSSWNLSGLIYLSPNAGALTVTLNQTWLLPSASRNTVQVMSEPLMNGSYGNPTVNILGPTQCLASRPYQPNGCNSSAAFFSETPFVAGNSTVLGTNGSAYPTGAGTPAGYAVYLTLCVQASPTSSPINPTFVVHPASCTFTYSNITTVVTNSGGGGSGITLPLGGACGQTLPVWAQLVGVIATVTGSSALGCLAAEALAFILLALIIAFVLAVVVAIFRRS